MTRTPDHTHLAALLACIQLGLRQEITNQLAGQPRAQAYDSDKTTGGGGSDPTATGAHVGNVGWTGDKPGEGEYLKQTTDPAAAHLALYDKHCRTAYNALLAIVSLSDLYLPTHQPRRAALQADTRTCHLHDKAAATTQHHHGKHRTDLGSYLDAPLKDPVHVCAACYEHARRIGRLPTTDELVRHDRTGKWAVRTSGKRATAFSAQDIADEWGGAA